MSIYHNVVFFDDICPDFGVKISRFFHEYNNGVKKSINIQTGSVSG